MSTINIGNITNAKFKVGSGDCSIYLGSVKLYPKGFDGKYKLTLSDSTVVTADCDSTSAITSAETSAYTSTIVSAEIGDCVTNIGYNAFGYSTLSSVTIPDSVTSIDGNAFSYCSSLTSVTIPNSVTSIGDYAFQNCYNLTSVTIPDSVTSIGNGTFVYCTSLTSINIPSGVTSIGGYAFDNCTSLTSINIPSGVTSIGGWALSDCSSLTSITVEADTPPTLASHAFDNTNNCPIYVPSEFVNMYKRHWSDYFDRIQAIPTSSTCSIIISEPITSYTPSDYEQVFSFADTKWYMKNNLDNMEEYGVYDVVGNIATATTYEGKLAAVDTTEYQFNNGSWEEVGTYEDSSVTYEIDNTASERYMGQELSTTFKIPMSDVESAISVDMTISSMDNEQLTVRLDGEMMNEYTYQGVDNYEGTVTNDGEYLYLSLPSEAPQSIVINVIEYMSMGTIHIIAGLKNITVEYEDKGVPSYSIYNTVEAMEEVSCPDVMINEYAFVGNDLYKYFANEEWSGITYYEPKAVGFYSSSSMVLYNNGNTTLEQNELQKDGLTSAYIGSGVTSIGNQAFFSCSSLTSITIPNSVTSIRYGAFSSCSSLTSITIPNSVTSIGDSTFSSCSSLTSITIPNSVTSIEHYAFSYCSGLTSAYIGSGVTSIGIGVFLNCSRLTSVTVNATTPPTIGTNAFKNTSNSLKIYVPAESVNAFKTASGWSTYASIIQAIP